MPNVIRHCDGAFLSIPVYTEIRKTDEVLSSKTGTLPYLMKFDSLFALLNSQNGNKRNYRSGIYFKEDDQGDYKNIAYFESDEYKFRLGKGLINGQIKHPKDEPDPTKISHVFDEFYKGKDGHLWCRGRIVDTIYGRALYGIKQAGVELGLSQRSLCDSEMRDGVEEMAPSYYFMEGADFVSVPAVSGAFPKYAKDEKKLDEIKSLLSKYVPQELADKVVTIFEDLDEENVAESEVKEDELKEDKIKVDQIQKKEPKFVFLVKSLIDKNRDLQKAIEERDTKIESLRVETKKKVNSNLLIETTVESIKEKAKAEIESSNEKVDQMSRAIDSIVSSNSVVVKKVESQVSTILEQRKKIIALEEAISKISKEKVTLENKIKNVESSVKTDSQLEKEKIQSLTLDNYKLERLLDLPVSLRDEAKRLFASLNTKKSVDDSIRVLKSSNTKDHKGRTVGVDVKVGKEQSLTGDLLRRTI